MMKAQKKPSNMPPTSCGRITRQWGSYLSRASWATPRRASYGFNTRTTNPAGILPSATAGPSSRSINAASRQMRGGRNTRLRSFALLSKSARIGAAYPFPFGAPRIWKATFSGGQWASARSQHGITETAGGGFISGGSIALKTTYFRGLRPSAAPSVKRTNTEGGE